MAIHMSDFFAPFIPKYPPLDTTRRNQKDEPTEEDDASRRPLGDDEMDLKIHGRDWLARLATTLKPLPE